MAKGGAKNNHGPSSSRKSHEIIGVDEKPPTAQVAAPSVDVQAAPPVYEQAAPFPSRGVLGNICVILAYVFFGMLMFWKTDKNLLDAFYGTSVSLTSVGYGDLVAEKTEDKWSMSFFLLCGFFLAADRVEELYDLIHYQAIMWLRQKGWYYNNWYINILLAVVGVTSLIGSGTGAIIFIESKDWKDALYLTVTSVTTVGFGDEHFKKTGGKWFATFWLPFSTTVARQLSKWVITLTKSARSYAIPKHD